MTEKKTQNKRTEEFLKDDFFLKSILHPTDETNAYWDNLIKNKEINETEFNKAKEILLSPPVSDSTDDIDKNLHRLWIRIQTSNRKKEKARLYFLISVAAACCIGVLFVFRLIIFQEEKPDDLFSGNYLFEMMEKEPFSDQIRLITDSTEMEWKEDTVLIRHKPGGIQINNGALIASESKAEITYHQLMVPFGKRSKVVLTDESIIIVNAGTRVIYPDRFTEGSREIYVDGEVYAKITHDDKRPFVIKTHELAIEVLGTAFNVTAYKDEPDKSVTLVEGAVKVIPSYDSGQTAFLKPNQRFYMKEAEQSVTEVDPENYISWTEGIYRFKKESLQNILARISKYYGVRIECGSSMQDMTCSGSLDLKDNLNAVLYDISLTTSLECTYIDGIYHFKEM